MRNVLTGIVDVCRVLALLILAVCAVGLGYLAVVTRLPPSAAPLAQADKIGPTYSRAPAPLATAALRSTPTVDKDAPRQVSAATPISTAASTSPQPIAAPRAAAEARVQTANLETGTLNDASEELSQPVAPSRRTSNKRTAGAAGCGYFRSFDPATQTYRAYDGRIRECRVR